jgi:hypothetical protein
MNPRVLELERLLKDHLVLLTKALDGNFHGLTLSIGGTDETHVDTDGKEKDRPRIIDKAYPIGRLVEFGG